MPTNPKFGTEELESGEIFDSSVDNLANLIASIKPPFAITDEDRARIEAAFSGKKMDNNAVRNLYYEEMIEAEKKENGSLAVLFAKKYDQEKGFIEMTLEDSKMHKVGDKILVNFQENEVALKKIEAEDFLPANVSKVKFCNSEGHSRIGEKRDGEKGFFDANGHIQISNNDTIEIIEMSS